MSVIATFAGKVFQVDSKKIYTFSDFSYTSTLKTEKQDIDVSKPSTYIKGADLDNFSINIKLNSSLGVNPRSEWNDWINILNRKIAYPFILGGVPLNNTKWLLTSVSPSNIVFDNNGKILSLDLSLKFEEYVRAGSKKESSTSTSSTSGSNTSTSVPGLLNLIENQSYSMSDDPSLKRQNTQMVAQSKIRSGHASIY